MAMIASSLVAPVSHAIRIPIHSLDQTRIDEDDVQVLLNLHRELRRDPTRRMIDNRGHSSNVSATAKEAILRFREKVYPEESYVQSLTNDFPIIDMPGMMPEATFNALHDPTQPVKLAEGEVGQPRFGFARQQVISCGQGYACTLHTQYPAFLPRLIIPIFGKVSLLHSIQHPSSVILRQIDA